MNGPYKIQLKLGGDEFAAEGAEQWVKEAYQAFLDARKQTAPTAPGPTTQQGQHHQNNQQVPTGIDPALLERVFIRSDDVVSLRHLPDTPNKIADAAILLLYGYRALQSLDDVPVMRLNEGLRQSGLSINRLDRFIGVNSGLFRRGGNRAGGRYTLNNQGIVQAETWLKSWFN